MCFVFQIVDALKSGHTTLKAAQEGMSAESVDKVMMDVEEVGGEKACT